MSVYLTDYILIQSNMKTYRNGPVDDQKRSCTDIICLIIFILFSLIMFTLAVYTWFAGDFKKLTTPYDPDGKGCGVDYPEFPYVYFVSPIPAQLWKTVCVRKCPQAENINLQCQTNSKISTCPTNTYKTYQFQKICMPQQEKIQSDISQALQLGSLGNQFLSLSQSWQVILLSIPIAIVLSVIIMCVIRFTAGIFVYILIAICVIGLMALGIYLFIPKSGPAIPYVAQSRTIDIMSGIILILLSIVILIIFCCFKKRFQLAAAIVKVAAVFVANNFWLIALPFVTFLATILFLTIWVLEVLGFYSLGQPVTYDQQLPFQHFQLDWKIKGLVLIHIFNLFWVFFFLKEGHDFIVSGAACSWYFRRDFPVFQSLRRTFRFHLGSVCMGSFFLALFGFMKFLYEILKPDDDSNQGFCGYFKKCMSCCCYVCVNYVFQWLNQGAYTLIHLASDNYCSSAWQAATLRLNQPVTSASVLFFQAFFSIIAKLSITALTVFAGHLIISSVEPWKSIVYDDTLTLIIIGLIGFTVSSLFISLYSEAVSSIYVSYLADISSGGDQNGPSQLKDFLIQARQQAHYQKVQEQ